VPRHRISLTLRLDDEAAAPAGDRGRPQDRSSENLGRTDRGARPRPRTSGSGASRPPEPDGALADALRKAGLAPKTPSNPEPRRHR
jgi:protein Tex